MLAKTFTLKFIPHSEQRYETVGDWIVDPDGNHEIRVSDMGDERYNWLVAFHELAEFMLCLQRGIKQEDVDAFDKAFEDKREDGNCDEPGDDIKAPYRKEHFFATTVERALSAEMGVDWKSYDDTVMSL